MTTLVSKSDVSLVNWVGRDGDIIKAARVSTQGIDAMHGTQGMGLINYLMKNRHGTPFEHNSMTFMVYAPMKYWWEQVRHRVGFSYNLESSRYKQMDPVFYLPTVAHKQEGKPGHYLITEAPELTHNMHNAMTVAAQVAIRQYELMLGYGIARDDASLVLPFNLMWSGFITCNARSLMNLLALRIDDPANAFTTKPWHGIQSVAEQMEAHFERLYPITHKAWVDNGRVAP